jgi:hypothetical protein
VLNRRLYLHNDNKIDAERCRISLREKSPVTLLSDGSVGASPEAESAPVNIVSRMPPPLDAATGAG